MTILPRDKFGLLLTTLLHMALLAALLARQHAGSPARSADRSAIAWILPAAPKSSQAAAPAQAADRRRTAITVPRQPVQPSVPASRAAAQEAASADAAASALPPASATENEPVIGDLSAQPAAPPMPAADLLRLTLYNAGKVDNELRKGKLAPLLPAKDTIRGKIDAAFEAAHQAVKPKWYEAARVSEISAHGSRTRVYKIRTALGTYCISVADPGSSMGGTRGPLYSNCP
ncbi:hypothetical protein [Pseudoduganella aquatica]|uniref:hypothetical protein n=1 Tax=Pseudoduganella aquatica TaxID=2660641 RepID=UPI001E519926|nr:hypothetical protein [Pseudoduganella aquatica]